MLTYQEWEKIKVELKRSIEPVFKKAGVTLVIPFEDIVDIFRGVLEKEINDNSLDDRVIIAQSLRKRYATTDWWNDSRSILLDLSIKFESYIKRLFHSNLANETLLNSSKNNMAEYLKTFWNKFKTTYNDSDFNFVSNQEIDKFFAKDGNNQPTYMPSSFSSNSMPLGEQFKTLYDLANAGRHLDPSISDDDIPKLITHVMSCYLFLILKYSKRIEKRVVHQVNTATISNWNIFKQYCGNFEKKQNYFLIIEPLNIGQEELSHFSNIKWDFIFDLDVKSHIDGLFAAFKSSNYPQAINQITHVGNDRGKITATFPNNTTFWFYAQGKNDRIDSLEPTGLFANWRTMYSRYIQDLLIAYYEKLYSFTLNPIKVVIVSTDIDKVKEIIYAIKGMDAKMPKVDFIFANEDNSVSNDLIHEISAKQISLPLSDLTEGLRGLEGTMLTSTTDKVYLPCHSSKGKSVLVPDSTIFSIYQYFRIIHLNILSEGKEPISNKSFYQGRAITWQELDNHLDVDRNITKDLIKEVRSALEKRLEAAIVYLTHYAGSGGSTVARRVAYELHKDYPVLFLNETVSSYTENLLVEKLIQVFQLTELPCLVVVDNSNITRFQIEILEKVAANRLAKTVFLIIESSFAEPSQQNDRFYIDATLDKSEADRFVMKFSEKYPDKSNDFSAIIQDKSSNILNPFYFGLIANEKEYITIDKYVKKRLDGLNSSEKELLTLLAFCQLFAKGKFRDVPHFVISNFLNLDEEYIRLKKHTVNSKIYDLIIETDDLSWRTIHPLIAEEILKQTFGKNDFGLLNPYGLKSFSIKLIKSLRTISDNRNEQVIEFLYNIYILRECEDNIESDDEIGSGLYDKKLFSKLINALGTNNNRLEVFDVLTKEFPDENAHFWGHFSRLYSIDKDFANAISTIEMAIDIDPDFIFYHIEGMCYRMELYRLKDQCWGKKDQAIKCRQEMWSLFEKASKSFSLTREKAPQKEHGYLSYVQMAIQMIDFEYSISEFRVQAKDKDYTPFIISNTLCRNVLTQTNEIISDYYDYNQEFENPRLKEKRLLLLKYFGEKDKMINAWNSLIGNQNYDQNLVRRQLSYAYLAKTDFDFTVAKNKDIRKILNLLEENLKNKIEVRDLQLWFEVGRQASVSENELIKKVQEWEFNKPSFETAYLLMCLFGIQAMNGAISAIDNYKKYRNETSDRVNINYSKVFCREWVGCQDGKPVLLNHRQIGVWTRNKQFFENTPSKLLRVKGCVVRYNNRGEGYIEISNCGIEAMYQPGTSDHYSDDAQKQTEVDFFIGFNYDGARAFEVKNRI